MVLDSSVWGWGDLIGWIVFTSKCPGPGRDQFAEEPSEDRERDREEASGVHGRQEKVSCVHFLISPEA